MAYVLSTRARQDLAHISKSIALRLGQQVADDLVDRVMATIDMLGRNPLMGRDRSSDLGTDRRNAVAGFCVIIYRPAGGNARIQRIVDGRRNYPAFIRHPS